MVAAVALACVSIPGLGTVTYKAHTVNLATCRTAPAAPAVRPAAAATVRIAHGRQTIRVAGRTIVSQPAWSPKTPRRSPGPIMLLGASPDRRWIFFANDPMGSQSIIADGIRLQVVSARGGRPRELLPTLAYDDYRTWCGGRLVLTAGGDRIATTNKWLATLAPPGWRPRVLQRTGAWGSTACAPDGKSVVAQSQAASDDGNFFHTHWALWRVGFDGSLRRLTSPPPGYADESPQFAGGTLYFVRSHHGVGKLYALRRGKLLGPLLSLGFDLGYYGHHGWQYSVRR